eukprot:Skav223905  [mRNA]  locus=scaffold5126:28544:28945:- [translate_table: standard]
MSKSKGNFFTLDEIIKLHLAAVYSADTVRLAMANSGDTLEPANFDQSVCTWTWKVSDDHGGWWESGDQ